MPVARSAQLTGIPEVDLIGRIIAGGFPEPALSGQRFRERWFGAYITTIIGREIQELAGIAGLADLPRLLAMLAARSATLLNVAELSRTSAIPQTTLHRYLALIEGLRDVYFAGLDGRPGAAAGSRAEAAHDRHGAGGLADRLGRQAPPDRS